MASNSIAQSGVERNPRLLEKSEWVWCDAYLGTKGELIAAGIAKQGQFPGDPGANKVAGTFDERGNPLRHRSFEKTAPGSIRIRRATRDRFHVWVAISEDEYERRSEADLAERIADGAEREARKAEESAKAEVQRIEKELTNTPATHEAFRKEAADFLLLALDLFQSAFMNREGEQVSAWGRHKSGFQFDAETRDEYHDVASELYHVVMNGTTIFDPQAHTRRLTEARAKVASMDAPLQRFLQSVSTDSPSLHN